MTDSTPFPPSSPELTLKVADPAERLGDGGRPPNVDAFLSQASPSPPEQVATMLLVDQRGR